MIANRRGKGDDTPETTVSAEAVRESSPDTYDKIHDAGKKAGADEAIVAERKRIQDIEAIDAPGFESIIAENKYKPEMTAEKVSALILTAQKDKRAESAKDQKDDAEKVAEDAKGAGTTGGGGDDVERSSMAKAMAEGGNEYRDGVGQPSKQPSK